MDIDVVIDVDKDVDRDIDIDKVYICTYTHVNIYICM